MIGILKKESKIASNKWVQRAFVFAKAQVSAFIGGVLDYSIMVFVTEVFHVHYTISIAIGGIVGALVNFSLNRYWTFPTKQQRYEHSAKKQLLKFVLVVANSIVLKSSGTYLVTTFLRMDYKISRLFVDLFVSIAINYNLQRYWVFKNAK
ncbi:MAG: GtrA family protein [Paludibacter sp.]|nr:GtrA family protein [Paludibacter sp.]